MAAFGELGGFVERVSLENFHVIERQRLSQRRRDNRQVGDEYAHAARCHSRNPDARPRIRQANRPSTA
jgi:hypothetical protein